jgi:hypothetical protein
MTLLNGLVGKGARKYESQGLSKGLETWQILLGISL